MFSTKNQHNFRTHYTGRLYDTYKCLMIYIEFTTYTFCILLFKITSITIVSCVTDHNPPDPYRSDPDPVHKILYGSGTYPTKKPSKRRCKNPDHLFVNGSE